MGRLSCAPHRPPALRTHMKLSAALLLGVVALAMAGGQEASVNSVAARRLGERPQGRQKAKVRGVLGADGTGDQTRPLVTSLGFGVIFVFFSPSEVPVVAFDVEVQAKKFNAICISPTVLSALFWGRWMVPS